MNQTNKLSQVRKLLIVDDTEFDRQRIIRALNGDLKTRYEFKELEHGKELEHVAMEWKPDLVVLDYSLPFLSGLELLEQFFKKYGKIPFPFIMATGAGDEPTAVKAMKLGALDYVSKDGLSSDTIRQIVTRALEKSALHQKLDKQQELLEQSERRLELTVNASGLGIWEWDLKSDRLFWSRETEYIMGYPPGNSGWRNLADFSVRIHPEDREATFEKVSRAMQNKTKYEHEFRICLPDGSIRWVSNNGQADYDPGGEPRLIRGTVGDITERKFFEEKLKESEANFRSITDAMPQIVWSTLPDGTHVYFNKQWYEFTGVPIGTTDGEGWLKMFHPEDHESTLKVWKHSLATGEPYEMEYRLRHHSGVYKWTLGRALPVRNEDGKIMRWMGTCTDIQEIREAREALIKSQKDLRIYVDELQSERELRERFVNTLTHDLRTPLTVAKISAQYILRKTGDKEALLKLAERIEDSLNRADQMINNLLDANRLKAGEKLPIDIEASEMNEIVVATLEDLRVVHGERLVLTSTNKIQGYWSKSGIQRIIENLCNNGIKYGTALRPVTISLAQIEEWVRIEVHNEGLPISPQDQSEIFNAFKRTDHAQAGNQLGWGLGLALVKGLAEAHGGTVGVKSNPNLGTTFWVKLPLDSRKAALSN